MPAGCTESPYELFSLFWDESVFEQLAVNTNLYAELKQDSQTQPGKQRRKWHKTTASELKVWIGLIIHMGLHKEPSISLYWSKGSSYGWRKIKKPTRRV